jgi:protein-tyrosine phosphatase
MKRSLTLIVILLSLAFSTGKADSIVSCQPQDGAVVSPLKTTQKLFLLLPDEAARKCLTESQMTSDFCHNVRSFPEGIELTWKFTGNRSAIHYQLAVSADPSLKDAKTYDPPHSEYRLYNLELGKTYYWQATACSADGSTLKTSIQHFTVENLPPRVMNVPNVDNFRDLGGRIGLEGRRIAQNLAFRSTGLNSNSTDGRHSGPPRFNDEGRQILLKDLGIKTELDLRSTLETAGMKQSPLGDTVKYINISSTCYDGLYCEGGQKNYAALFRVFCDKANYPICYHCIAGADRTGSLSFLLEAVLGVSKEEIARDYVFTSFYTTRDYRGFDSLLKGLETYGKPDESLCVKAERYLIKAGITPEEITAFRAIMLGKPIKPSAK